MTDEELAKHIEASEPPLMPEFLSWWNSTHDFDFVKDGGLYEKHALRCWMAGRNAATALERAEQPVVTVKPEWSYFQGLVNIAFRSAAKAKAKFPQPNYVTLKIAEEAGEVVRGAVHYAEGRMEWDEVQGEIVQLLAMLIRFVTEGDEVNGVIPPAHILSAITVDT